MEKGAGGSGTVEEGRRRSAEGDVRRGVVSVRVRAGAAADGAAGVARAGCVGRASRGP